MCATTGSLARPVLFPVKQAITVLRFECLCLTPVVVITGVTKVTGKPLVNGARPASGLIFLGFGTCPI
jgi:hypothetical protein